MLSNFEKKNPNFKKLFPNSVISGNYLRTFSIIFNNLLINFIIYLKQKWEQCPTSFFTERLKIRSTPCICKYCPGVKMFWGYMFFDQFILQRYGKERPKVNETFLTLDTSQKIKFSIKDFFSKCDQIRRKLEIWSNLWKKSLMENRIFCAVREFSCNEDGKIAW